MAFDSTAYPYDTVVRITDTIGNQDYQASGVLISPDEVLTASHVVNIAGVGAASNIVVTPAYDDGTAPFGSADGTLVHYFPIDDANGQISNDAAQSDYAVIHLSTPFTGLGTMGLSASFVGGPVTIAGYPVSANGAMVANTQTVYPDPNYTLLDGVTLGKGSSGGPLFVGGATDPQVVGIVSSESDVNQTGYNTLITTAVFNQIERWVKADDATAASPSPPATIRDQTVTVNRTQSHCIIANNSGSSYDRFDRTGNAEEVARLNGGAFGRSTDLSGLNDWTHLLDANSLQLDNASMAFIGSPEFQSKYGFLTNPNFVEHALGRPGDPSGIAYRTAETPEFPSMFAGLSASAATDLLNENVFHQARDPAGIKFWSGQIPAEASMSQGLLGFAGLQNHIATAGVTHDAWIHNS